EVEGRRLTLQGTPHIAEGQPVVYGIRPEHVALAADGLPAQVAVVEPTGADTMVLFRFGTHAIVAVFHERHELWPGQTVFLAPRRDFAHVFDSRTGLRL
ncbi:MAG TPA: TOBE domain-containing protein, partial [Paracoccaceae bacterium]|nr:TOBE domain-containing protein [Paracoccaceae bacterium]